MCQEGFTGFGAFLKDAQTLNNRNLSSGAKGPFFKRCLALELCRMLSFEEGSETPKPLIIKP